METITPAQAIDSLWRRGVLTWKLRSVQERMYSAIRSTESLKYVVNSARRLGKSYLMCCMSIEDAIQIPEAQIRFAAPTQKSLKKIIFPLMRQILLDCPETIRPILKKQDGVYLFPHNGSEIHISGANNGHDENLRGTAAHRCYIDEAGFIKDLNYLVEDIMMPQLLTTGGSLVASSTPPRTPAHDFVAYAQKAELDGYYSKYTIHEAGYPPDVIKRFCQEAGGDWSTTWRREYLCEFIVDENYAVTPEWRSQFETSAPIDEYYKFYPRVVSMDIGVSDFTAVLFGYYDFKRAKLFIQDELIMHGPQMTTDKLAGAIRKKEKELWGEGHKIGMRIADNNNPLLLQDLGAMHGIHFAPTNKDEIEAMVNNLRVFVNSGQVIVDPKCAQTIGCLKYGIWEENRKKFAKSAVYGHFDALASLIYLVRNLDTHTNPIPPLYKLDESTHHIGDIDKQTAEQKAVQEMLGLGGKR